MKNNVNSHPSPTSFLLQNHFTTTTGGGQPFLLTFFKEPVLSASMCFYHEPDKRPLSSGPFPLKNLKKKIKEKKRKRPT
jgi:hypothetical protein